MGALGNILDILAIPLPLVFLGRPIVVTFTYLPMILLGAACGPIPGAITGALSLLMVVFRTSPLSFGGGIIVGGVTGVASKKVRPLIASFIAVLCEIPYDWLIIILRAHFIAGVPIATATAILPFLTVKWVIEVLIAGLVVEVLLRNRYIVATLRSLVAV